MRSWAYVRLLLVAVVLGIPIAAGAFFFLKLTELLQEGTFTDLPHELGYDPVPAWWPLAPLALAGVVVGAVIRYLPGEGGESPAEGFHPGGVAPARALPGILLAAVASIGLGAVLGPEMPLIALGAGLASLSVRLIRRDVPAQTGAVLAATGSFAAISTLLGTPLAGAFLLLEASTVGGAVATAVLLPGLLAAGIGALVFTGLNSVTGYGTFSLAVPDLPPVGSPTVAQFGWAIAIGLVVAPSAVGLRRLALAIQDRVRRRLVLATTVMGLVIAGLAIGYAEATGHEASDVLFSGQAALPGLLRTGGEYSAGAMALLVVCKGLAYAAALSAFRGGPVFPALFVGAALGILFSHLPGLPLVPAAAMGMAAMIAAMLRLPMTAVLLTTLMLGSGGFPAMPLTIVAAVTAYVAETWLTVVADVPEPAAPRGPTPEQRGAPVEPAPGSQAPLR